METASTAEQQPEYLAHIVQRANGSWEKHLLREHLQGTAERAALAASVFKAEDWARLAGLWHDLGKYSAAFQKRIRSVTGFEAHIEGVGRVDHSTAGAIHAQHQLGPAGQILAYLIAGHHAGLPDWYGDNQAAAALSHRLNQPEHLASLPLDSLPAELLDPGLRPRGTIPGGQAGAHLWLRMLFSCLVDGDFLDTEAFMSPEKAKARGHKTDLQSLLVRFNGHMEQFAGRPATSVNHIRAEVLARCRIMAGSPPGIFSLTVPTGGGKTLASMAFALEHAHRYGKRRIIYAIPYTSIIEQTADIFRDIFGEAIIEHHSGLDPEQETPKSRLAAENWDAPIVVTTNVQLFESLFAARTSRCRKLHNLVNSVIVLDEAQTLPPELLQPCLDALNLLVRHYGVTLLLCTATQPALTEVNSFGRALRGLDPEREIMEQPDRLFAALKRVDIELPPDFEARRDWDDLAAEIGAHPSVLSILNSRRDARDLWQRMPQGSIHLSASLCGAHRARRIAEIRARLKDGESVRVISTQLIEAGVDVDFPVVYRALSGLDSIAQAAGRCNREGLLEKGRVIVFIGPRSSPPGQLRRAEQTTISLMSGTGLDPLAPATFKIYFRHFYLDAPSWDRYGLEKQLMRDACKLQFQFRSAATQFRYVDDADSQPILVWWGESRSLIGQLAKDGPERWLMRKLQRYAVNLPRRTVEHLLTTGEVREVWPGLFAQDVDTLYEADLGLVAEGPVDAGQLFI